MAAPFHFEHTFDFISERASEILSSIPTQAGVFALCGVDPAAQPYLTRAADLRRRIRRLLDPPASQSKRLNLRERVARIEYTVTGSEFESTLLLYHATSAHFGAVEARRRLRLHTPFMARVTVENHYPRAYVTNKLSKRGLAHTYGPFPSRAGAERYCDAVLDLFKVRRCHEDLEPYPEHPGCVYGEMGKCLAPCNQSCTDAQYAAEAEAMQAFFDTGGRSMLSALEAAREQASAEMEFERAAELHTQWQKVKTATALADELVRTIPLLRGVIVQPSAQQDKVHASLFLLHAGCLTGPEPLSTLGVRAVKQQTEVGSSLFAQPLMLQAIPLEGEPAATPTHSPEARAEAALSALEAPSGKPADLTTLSDHLSLLRRWYYRPEKHRTGELFLPNLDGAWPIRRILNAAARAALGDPEPMAETRRDLATRNPEEPVQPPAKTKVLHAGRPDVEREVSVVDRPLFRSRRSRPSHIP
ncbi:MAG TPA: UvrB/UvrC motif-containing protein [Granulicella sp.]